MKNFGVFFKRTVFFLATNFIITATLFIVANLVMNHFQIEVQGLNFYIIFYSIIGMGGSFISLWMSKSLAIRAMGVKLIDNKQPISQEYLHLVEKVHFLANKAGLPVKPDVGIYDSPDVNAFATGPSKKNSLVAVSTGLLQHMNSEEVEGVLAHEVAHIANGDMVTMCLIQGVVNTMVYIIADVLTNMIIAAMKVRRSFFMYIIIRQIVASLLYIPGSMLVCFFSRWREFRADYGGAKFAGKGKMTAALRSLAQISQNNALLARQEPKQSTKYNYLKINSNKKSSLISRLFSTHPPIETRIRRLQYSVL